MSHSAERKEKDCLNCGTIVQGRYCQVCGQENTEPKETFWGMVMHFFADITHFDGKFFVTLKDLLFKPGFLSAEYTRGRRVRYLHPVRMYVFTSAIFFLIFFSFRGDDEVVKFNNDDFFTLEQRDSVAKRVTRKLEEDTADSNLLKQLSLLADTSTSLRPSDLLPYEDRFSVVGTIGRDYKSRQEYDSIQHSLPKASKDSWLVALWNKKALALDEKYKYQPRMSVQKLTDSILHRLPYLLFVSLPFFALILKLLYVRRKNFYYADHAIFSIHHYIFSFILLLFVFFLDKLGDVSHWSIWGWFIFFSILAWPVYLYIAMKKFYKQRHWKTFVKFFFLNILGLVVLTILLMIFFLFSVFQL